MECLNAELSWQAAAVPEPEAAAVLRCGHAVCGGRPTAIKDRSRRWGAVQPYDRFRRFAEEVAGDDDGFLLFALVFFEVESFVLAAALCARATL